MKKIVVLLFSLFLFFGCNPAITVNIEPLIQKQNAKQNPVNYQSLKNDLIKKQIESMTLESKIAQMLLISVDGTSNSENVYLYKDDYAPGGFLLFRYNVDSANTKQ